MGQADRESVSVGATYSGQDKPCPAALLGTTWPGLREGVMKFSMKRPKSHPKTKRLMKKPKNLLRKPMMFNHSMRVIEEGKGNGKGELF
jgi:hypothetical protein